MSQARAKQRIVTFSHGTHTQRCATARLQVRNAQVTRSPAARMPVQTLARRSARATGSCIYSGSPCVSREQTRDRVEGLAHAQPRTRHVTDSPSRA